MDFQTAQRLDTPVAPLLTANDEFFTFVFGASGQDYAELKARAERRETLPPVALGDVTITINVDAEYDVVQTRLTRNVVGMVRGADPGLADSYVMLGAHYDHIGYRQFAPPASPATPAAPDPLIAAARGRRGPRSGRATSSTTAPMTTGRARWASWRSRARSPRARGPAGRCSSCGTRRRRAGSPARATWPTTPWCRSTAWPRSSTST